MTTGTIVAQGTELFFVDSLSSSVAEVLKMACPTGITGVNTGARDQIEDTCLDNTTDKTYKPGLGNPGQITVPFNFIPSNGSHQMLFDLKESGEVIEWLMGLSNGTAVPTLDSNDRMIPPAAPLRTSLGFDAYVADVSIDAASNTLVVGTLTLQRSGPVRTHWNGPIPT